MHLSKEEEMAKRHYRDLIQMSYQRSIPVYGQFADLREMGFAYQALEDFYGGSACEGKHYLLYGGYEDAERRVVCFLPAEVSYPIAETDFPIRCIEITPLNPRFCEDLSHRDYLGTVMGLGITRDQIGDILVDTEKAAPVCYLFCKSDKAQLITELNRVRHTTVQARVIDFSLSGWTRQYKELTGSISSHRLDALLAMVTRLSRGKALELIQSGSVFLNGRCCTENAKKIQEGDVFSVRGYGKYRFEKTTAQSKKGRYHVTVNQYI